MRPGKLPAHISFRARPVPAASAASSSALQAGDSPGHVVEGDMMDRWGSWPPALPWTILRRAQRPSSAGRQRQRRRRRYGALSQTAGRYACHVRTSRSCKRAGPPAPGPGRGAARGASTCVFCSGCSRPCPQDLRCEMKAMREAGLSKDPHGTVQLLFWLLKLTSASAQLCRAGGAREPLLFSQAWPCRFEGMPPSL